MSFLLAIARTKPGGKLARWIFARMSFILPVNRLLETPTLLVFHHPRPSYPLHILIVSKREITSFTDITHSDTNLLSDLIEVVKHLVGEFKLEESGYRLITNGGNYQDVPQLHFHLISEKEPLDKIEQVFYK